MTKEPPPPPRPAARKAYEPFARAGSELPRLALRCGDLIHSIPNFAVDSFVFHFRTGDRITF
jgi:hypothetical protein